MKKEKCFIHKDAVVESKTIGAGTRIWRNVHVLPGAIIGKNCNIGEGCYIESHVRIGNGVTIKNNVAVWDNITLEDDVFVGPSAVFTNDHVPRARNKKGHRELDGILVRTGATIGANATIICPRIIHSHAFVGAGAVVTKNVPAHHVVYGNPARFKGLICSCGRLSKGAESVLPVRLRKKLQALKVIMESDACVRIAAGASKEIHGNADFKKDIHG